MSDEKINIKDLNRADVLAALYNASKPQGMGFMHYDPTPMRREEAEALLKQGKRFDYLKGRVMKVELSGNEFDPWGYDRDNGPGSAKAALNSLRGLKDTNTPQIQKMHKESTFESAIEANKGLTTPSTIKDEDGVAVLTLGLGEFANVLGPKIDQAIKRNKK
jgi:hypothetical protein